MSSSCVSRRSRGVKYLLWLLMAPFDPRLEEDPVAVIAMGFMAEVSDLHRKSVEGRESSGSVILKLILLRFSPLSWCESSVLNADAFDLPNEV